MHWQRNVPPFLAQVDVEGEKHLLAAAAWSGRGRIAWRSSSGRRASVRGGLGLGFAAPDLRGLVDDRLSKISVKYARISEKIRQISLNFGRNFAP